MATKTKAELQGQATRRIFFSVLFGLSLAYLGWAYVPIPVPTSGDVRDHLIFALRWLPLSLVPMFIGIRLVGSVRYQNMDVAGVHTTSPVAEELVRLRQRALQNTLEQTAMHVPLLLALSTHLDTGYLKLVPIVVCLFVLGRLMYFVGYLFVGDQFSRGPGFAITLFSNLIPMGFCLYRLAMGGSTYGLPLA